jgi:hypothetical protein
MVKTMQISALCKSLWLYLMAIKRSFLAFVITVILGLLSMGLLGAALHFAVYVALPASYPFLNDARGDWVWPATIIIGMGWSLAFLVAGDINLRLARKGTATALRRFIYIAILWVWAFIMWFATLAMQYTF